MDEIRLYFPRIEEVDYDSAAAEQYLSDIKRELLDFQIKEIRDVGMGVGAGFGAWEIALFLGGVFLLGEQIEKNLEAWMRLGKRLRKLLLHLQNKNMGPLINKEAAIIIAASKILENIEHSSFSIVHSFTLINHMGSHALVPKDIPPEGTLFGTEDRPEYGFKYFFIFSIPVNRLQEEIQILSVDAGGEVCNFGKGCRAD